ncbi:MAG TPA: hypothetical protein VNA89_00030 [Gemmatimonadaceae bacterium]|nr:hypothetical protein [Gemmatimonadaceae bacterium]
MQHHPRDRGPGDRYEREQEALDPHRTEDRDHAVSGLTARLRQRGVTLTGRETSDDIADLVEAVERFERAVESHGGDLMVDTLPAREPDDPRFVLPPRGARESVATYLGRVDEATEELRRRRPRA